MKTAPIWISKNFLPAALCWKTARNISAALLLFSQMVFADLAPKTFELQSHSRVKGMNVTAQQSLTLDNGVYQLRQITKAPMISINEVSSFRIDSQQHIIPISYEYERSVFGKKLNRKNLFSADQLSASYQENKQTPIEILTPEPVVDELSFIIAVQQWLKQRPSDETHKTISVLDEKRIREHHYQVIGKEAIHTNMGWFNTTIIERVRNNNDKTTTIWLADDWDFLVIKMKHTDASEGEQTIIIDNGMLNEKKLQGSETEPNTQSSK